MDRDSAARGEPEAPETGHLPGAGTAEVIHVRFAPDSARTRSRASDIHEVSAATVLAGLR